LPAAKRWFAGNAMGLGGRKARIQRPGFDNGKALNHD
jgi:2-octaprenyl-6-methoxyphenol hydroxylase